MWIWVGEQKGKAPITGVPGRNLTDAEFDHYRGKVDAENPDDLGGLERSGLYEHAKKKGSGEATTTEEVSDGRDD